MGWHIYCVMMLFGVLGRKENNFLYGVVAPEDNNAKTLYVTYVTYTLNILDHVLFKVYKFLCASDCFKPYKKRIF